MYKFSDFVNSESVENVKVNNTNTNTNKNDLDQNDMEQLINKYSAYNQNELMNEFMRLTLEKKKKGELGQKELSDLRQTIIPFLNDDQKNNLEKIMNMVDNVK